jgi:hypothetical protein
VDARLVSAVKPNILHRVSLREGVAASNLAARAAASNRSIKISASLAVLHGCSGALSAALRLRFNSPAPIEACSELEAVGAEFRPGTARLIATKESPGRADQSCHDTSPLIVRIGG